MVGHSEGYGAGAAVCREPLPLAGRREANAGNRRRCHAHGFPDGNLHGIHSWPCREPLNCAALERLHYVVDLVAVGFTRELGPLLTAIAVSGRSGSAFAAEIGTMKVTEELDSLRVMALEPVEFVLAPKYLAALISVPCLSIISNFFGILAGGLFMFFSTRLAPLLYVHYVFNSINLRDVITGLIKSVVFATIIAHVGCLEGFRVRGGPDSVGRSTTSAVVKSTFLVIVADAVFTAIFYFTVKL